LINFLHKSKKLNTSSQQNNETTETNHQNISDTKSSMSDTKSSTYKGNYQPNTRKLFKLLDKYPSPKEAIRTPKTKPNEEVTPIHDIITANLQELIPNLNIGYQLDMESNQLIDWIEQARAYSRSLNAEFQKQCDKRMNRLLQIEEGKERSRNLNMDAVQKLPEDIIRHIHGFLLPETKLVLLRARYPNLMNNLKKLNVKSLKTLLKFYKQKCYEPLLKSFINSNNNRARCFPPDLWRVSFTYKGKENAINVVSTFLGLCENAKPFTNRDHRYFQTKTLRLVKVILYLLKKKQKLEPAYAPEKGTGKGKGTERK